MSTSRLIEHAVSQSNEWLHSLNARLQLSDDRSSIAAMRAVLGLLRDRLPDNEAADLGAQLPTLIRGLYYEGYHPARTPIKLRHLDEFLVALSDRLQAHPEVPPDSAARAVFSLLEHEISHGEVDDIVSCLPRELLVLWPDETVARIKERETGEPLDT